MTKPTSTTRALAGRLESANFTAPAEQMVLPEVPTVPPIEPAMPSKGSAAYTALVDLVQGPLTTLDWVRFRENWKLGDAMYCLKKLGWHWVAEDVVADGRSCAQYTLSPAHAEIAARKLGEQQ